MEEIDADTSNIFEKIDAWLDGFLGLLPNIGVAIVVLLIFFGAGILVSRLVRSVAKNRGRDSLGEVGGSLTRWALFILGVIVTCCSFLSFAVTFSREAETDAREATERAMGGGQLQPSAA